MHIYSCIFDKLFQVQMQISQIFDKVSGEFLEENDYA